VNPGRVHEIAEWVKRSPEYAGSWGCMLLWGHWGMGPHGEKYPHLLGAPGYLIFRSPETDSEKSCENGSMATVGRILHDPALSAEAFKLADAVYRELQ
jgi:hypothetical protein